MLYDNGVFGLRNSCNKSYPQNVGYLESECSKGQRYLGISLGSSSNSSWSVEHDVACVLAVQTNIDSLER